MVGSQDAPAWAVGSPSGAQALVPPPYTIRPCSDLMGLQSPMFWRACQNKANGITLLGVCVWGDRASFLAVGVPRGEGISGPVLGGQGGL